MYISLPDRAYEAIKNMILDKAFSPKQKLLFSDLERVLQMSRTPIIKALNLLVNKGLVVHIKNRGYFAGSHGEADNDLPLLSDETFINNMIKHRENFNKSGEIGASGMSLDQAVYGILREMILTSKFTPGQKLIYADLAKILGTSKTPITSALARLENEGYVQLKPNTGYFVSNIGADEFHEMLEARVTIEVANIDYVVSNITNQDFEKLEAVNRIYKDYRPDHFDKKKSQLNENFHLQLARIGKNRFMIRYIEHLYGWLSLRGRFTMVPATRITKSGMEHSRILSALKKRDKSPVRKLLEDHLRAPIQDVMKSLNFPKFD